MNKFILNKAALARAAKELGLTRPVRVTFDRVLEGGTVHGQQGFESRSRPGMPPNDFSDVAYRIRIAEACGGHGPLSVEDATETLLHELRHAAQHDDNPIASSRAYDRENYVHGYKGNAFERDANGWAEANLDRYRDLLELNPEWTAPDSEWTTPSSDFLAGARRITLDDLFSLLSVS